MTRTKEEIAEYQKIYKEENYVRLRIYRSEWIRRKRLIDKGVDIPQIRLRDIPKDIEVTASGKTYNRPPETETKNLEEKIGINCQRCSILLKSKYAGINDKVHCEDCLKELCLTTK